MAVDNSEKDDSKTSFTKWRDCLFGIVSKFQTRRSWVGIMFLLGTTDVIINLWYFVNMYDERLKYALVIGPASSDLRISMLVFTIVGTLLYFPETVNTFSALHSTDGDTLVPIHLEQVVTLLFEHIPLAIVDYFVARCRRYFTPAVASWCHSVRLVFIFLRLVWYAHIEGGKLRKNDRYEIKQVLVLFCFLLYSVTIAFNVLNVRWAPDTRLTDYHLVNVSVFLLKYPSPPEQLTFVIPLTEVLRRQSGPDLDNAQLTDSLLAFLTDENEINYNASIMSQYVCHKSDEWPPECDKAKFLSFRFTYAQSEWSPYGELRYNFARICPQDSNETCVDSTDTLKDGWELFFYEAHKTVDASNNMTVEVNVSAPFRKAYTHPMPRYSSQETVCSHANLDNVQCSN